MSGVQEAAHNRMTAATMTTVSYPNDDLEGQDSWQEKFILETLGVAVDEPSEPADFNLSDLSFDIPQETQQVGGTHSAFKVPVSAIPAIPSVSCQKPNESSNGRMEGESMSKEIKTRPNVTPRLVVTRAEDLEELSFSELRILYRSQKEEMKRKERMIEHMNSLVNEEQEMRVMFRRKRDEIQRELNRSKETLANLTLVYDQLRRENEDLRRSSASDKLIISQLEAKLADFKFDNRKMELQLKDSGEFDVPKLKDEVRELRKRVKNLERTVDEKNETISKLRHNLDAARSSAVTVGDTAAKEKEVEDLKDLVSKLRSELCDWMDSVMKLRREMHGALPGKKNLKSSPEYLSETDIDIMMRSYPSTYSNDDYGVFDSYTPSPASSFSSISPPLSIASTFSSSAGEKVTPKMANSKLSSNVAVARAIRTVEERKSEIQAADTVSAVTRRRSSSSSPVISSDSNLLDSPTVISQTSTSQKITTEGHPLTLPSDKCPEVVSEPLPAVTPITNSVPKPRSPIKVVITVCETTAVDEVNDQPSNIADINDATDDFAVDVQDVSLTTSCQEESSLQVPVVTAAQLCSPTKKNILATAAEPQRTAKRKKVKSKRATRSVFDLSDSSDSDLSDSTDMHSPLKLKQPERRTSPRKLSPLKRTVSPTKAVSPRKVYSPKVSSPKKRKVEAKSPSVQLRSKLNSPKPQANFTDSDSSSSSDSSNESTSSESDEDDTHLPDKVVPADPNTRLPEDSAVRLVATSSVNQGVESQSVPDNVEDSNSKKSEESAAVASLADDLRMTSDESSSEEELTDTTVVTQVPRDLETTVASRATEESAKKGDEGCLRGLSDGKVRNEVAEVESTLKKSPKRRLSFSACSQSAKPQIPAKTVINVVPKRVPTLPAVFRPQKPLQSIVERKGAVVNNFRLPTEPEVAVSQENPPKRICMSRGPNPLAGKEREPIVPVKAVVSNAVVPCAPNRRVAAAVRTPDIPKTSTIGGSEKRMSARQRIGKCFEIVAVGSGENICDKRKLELRVREQVERRKAEKNNGDLKASMSEIMEIQPKLDSGGKPPQSLAPPVKILNSREAKPPRSLAPLVKTLNSREASRPANTGHTNQKSSASAAVKEPSSLPVTTSSVAKAKVASACTINDKAAATKFPPHPRVLPPLETPLEVSNMTRRIARTRRTSVNEIPERTMSTRRTPVKHETKEVAPRTTVCNSAKKMDSKEEAPQKAKVQTDSPPTKSNSSSPKKATKAKAPPTVAPPILSPPVPLTSQYPQPHVNASPPAKSTSSSQKKATNAKAPPTVAPPILSPPVPLTSLYSEPHVNACGSPCIPQEADDLPPVLEKFGDEFPSGSHVMTRAKASQKNPSEETIERPIQTSKMSYQTLLFGKYSRSLASEEILKHLQCLIQSGEIPMSPEAFAKSLYFEFCDCVNNYLTTKVGEQVLISGCEKACANIQMLKDLRPDIYGDLESIIVLYFCTEVLDAPARYAYQKNDLLNQLAVCYGTVCRYFGLRDLSFHLLRTVMISRAPQKFTFAHGFVLAYPDLWSNPFEFGSTLEQCILVGLMHGSLYTNSIYFKNLRAMICDGIGLHLPTSSYAESFSAFVDEFKELEFEHTIKDCARGLGMLLLQAKWYLSKKIIEQECERLLKDWEAKKITDMTLGVFLNTTIWASELARDPEPGFTELLSIFTRIKDRLVSIPAEEVSPYLLDVVTDGMAKISHLIQRGPLSEPELVYYRIEDELEVKKQISKAKQSEKKKRKKSRKKEEARKQKKLLEELARIDT